MDNPYFHLNVLSKFLRWHQKKVQGFWQNFQNNVDMPNLDTFLHAPTSSETWYMKLVQHD